VKEKPINVGAPADVFIAPDPILAVRLKKCTAL